MSRTSSVLFGLAVIVVMTWAANRHASAQSASLALVHLETNAVSQPLGIDDRAPRFSWVLSSDQRGVSQVAFRVLVASAPDLAREGKADIWDSKQVSSSDPFVVYAGPALKARTRYYWKARVWAKGSVASIWSNAVWFETALLDANEWKGQWIAGPERPGPLSETEGKADDDLIRKAGEFCRPPSWPTSGFAAQRFKSNQGQCRELRPAPMLRPLASPR